MYHASSGIICSLETPSEKYWEIIAERRRVALADALQENMEVCFVVMEIFEMVAVV